MNLRSFLAPVSALALVAVVSLVFLSASASPSTQGLPPVEADSAAALLNSPRHGEWVTISGAGTAPYQAWVVYPERSTKAPVLILIHEIFGLTDWARAVADRYAAEGFLVVAPDFLSGKAPDGIGGSSVLGPEASRAAVGRLAAPEIIARLNAAATWGTNQPSATTAYGVVGFCWGGGMSFSWATTQPGLKAAVFYYGTAPAKEALTNVKAPLLGLYGGNDARVTSTSGPAKVELTRLGKRFDVEVYEGAGHAFLRQRTGANQAAAERAWPRSLEFLRENLEGKPLGSSTSSTELLASADECVDCVEPTLVTLK